MDINFRATKRPDHVKAPTHWQTSNPVPAPGKDDPRQTAEVQNGPTRYGDWELKGIAVDF